MVSLAGGGSDRHLQNPPGAAICGLLRSRGRGVPWESDVDTCDSLPRGGAITATVGILIRRGLGDGLEGMPVHVPWGSLGLIGAVCLVIAAVAAWAPTPRMLKNIHPSQAAE